MIARMSNDSKSIEYDVIEIQSRSVSDPALSDIGFKNKMAWVWTTLKLRYPLIALFSGNYPQLNCTLSV